jgi:hypothetical protein
MGRTVEMKLKQQCHNGDHAMIENHLQSIKATAIAAKAHVFKTIMCPKCDEYDKFLCMRHRFCRNSDGMYCHVNFKVLNMMVYVGPIN